MWDGVTVTAVFFQWQKMAGKAIVAPSTYSSCGTEGKVTVSNFRFLREIFKGGWGSYGNVFKLTSPRFKGNLKRSHITLTQCPIWSLLAIFSVSSIFKKGGSVDIFRLFFFLTNLIPTGFVRLYFKDPAGQRVISPWSNVCIIHIRIKQLNNKFWLKSQPPLRKDLHFGLIVSI